MFTANQDIRAAAKKAGVKLWQIAAAFGMQDSNFSKMLRDELPFEKKAKIIAIIEDLQRGLKNAAHENH